MSLWTAIERDIAAATGEPFTVSEQRAVRGGCINATAVIAGGGRRYFVKLNDATRSAMFEAEAAGLAEIIHSDTVRAPKPVCAGRGGGKAWLVLEYLDLGGRGGEPSDALLGTGLAALHRTTRPRFGWARDNTIGSTAQINTEGPDWPTFYREHRLRFQLELAAENGYRGRLQTLGERLGAMVPAFFRSYRPAPSLLHGDLWGGNRGVLADGTPVIFDPAVYYGDREADLAMTELFGGFGRDFYASYRESWPLDDGYRIRKDLYNLYHVLNHLNLFGGYLGQVERLMERLLAETG